MTEHEIKTKLRRAYENATPDILDSVLNDNEQRREVKMSENKKTPARRPWLKYIAAAACLCILIGGALGINGIRLDRAVNATVSLDVNPGVEISVNRKDRVLDVKPLNGDGEIILAGMDLSGTKLDVAVNALIGSMLKNGYINEKANSILISVDTSDTARGERLQKQLSEEASRLLSAENLDPSVISQTVNADDGLKELASEYNISAGKVRLINELIAQDAARSFEQLAKLTINELNLLLRSTEKTGTGLDITGSASDGAYIGAERAAQLAFEHAGVSAAAAEALEIEMDYEDGKMVYEVEFLAGGYEYDYDIDAATGAVLKAEKEFKGEAPATVISASDALRIALGHAGVSAAAASGVKTDLDIDDGIAVYEVEFLAGGYEYEYDIDAATGTVLKCEKEFKGEAPATVISASEALRIALGHAGVSAAEAKETKTDLDIDDGVAVYEVEFLAGGYEYEYDIDAATGAVLKCEKEHS